LGFLATLLLSVNIHRNRFIRSTQGRRGQELRIGGRLRQAGLLQRRQRNPRRRAPHFARPVRPPARWRPGVDFKSLPGPMSLFLKYLRIKNGGFLNTRS
jgi:hypothetical protein